MKKQRVLCILSAVILLLAGYFGRGAIDSYSLKKPAKPEINAIKPTEPVEGTVSAAANFKAENPSESQIYNRPVNIYDGNVNDTVLLIKNFKTYQQTSEYSCGPACMVMLLDYYGIKDVGEDTLSKEMDARYYDKPRADGSYGTTTSALAKALTDRGFRVQTSKDTENADGYSFTDIDMFTEFIKKQLGNGNPILTENVEWGGHWMILIGYDDMGTKSQCDDTLIFADPYDVSDQYQDGYITKNCYRFYSEWFDYNILPADEKIQQYVVVIK